MFQFPSLASDTYVFSDGSRGFAAGGCPIRRSPGQCLLGGSPELIAACHVLHRLLTPGHPPCALVRLTTTQRMKEFRTAHSESVVKERERDTSRTESKKITLRPSGDNGLPSRSTKETRCLQPAFAPHDRITPDASGATAGQPSPFGQRLVEVNGIEPMASWLQTRRSPN